MRYLIMCVLAGLVLAGCGGSSPDAGPGSGTTTTEAAKPRASRTAKPRASRTPKPDVSEERTAEAVKAIEAVTEWDEHLAGYTQRVYEYSVKPKSVLNLHTQETDKEEAKKMANTVAVAIYSDLDWLESVRVYGAGGRELTWVDVPAM